MTEWLYYVLLVVVLLAGLVLNLFTLPGNWVMWLALLGYAWVTGGRYVNWIWLAVLLAIAAAAEVWEFLAAGAGAKKAGGTLWGTIGALLGAILGAIFLTGLIPIPIVGTLCGIILGTFLGAWGAEVLGGKEVGESAEIGYGAAKGRFWGTMLKFGFGCVIFVLALIAALPLGGPPPVPVPAPSAPAPVAPPPVAPAQGSPAS